MAGRSTRSLERMQQAVSREDAIVDPKYWKAWLAIAAIGLVATLIVAALFGAGPIDVLLLRNSAVAPFIIVDYVLLAGGVVQAVRLWFRSGRSERNV